MTAPTETRENQEAALQEHQAGRLRSSLFRGPAPNEMRDHLANVRTFLAWVRTAITIMAFGFVVAKFGLLLRELPGQHIHPAELHLATIIGSILVLLGALFLVLATLDFLVVKRQIDAKVIAFSAGIHILLAGVLFVIAVGVATYIWVTAYG
jgi:putative membrane protein